MIYHILTQNKQKNWTGEHYSKNKVLCTNVLLKYCVNLCVNYALAIQLQRATRIESWILSALCPSQQRKNRDTLWFWCDRSWKTLSEPPVLRGAAQHKDDKQFLKFKYTKCSPDSYHSYHKNIQRHFSSIHMPTFRSNTMWRSFQTY